MGAHLIDGEFQSDKYPTCPRGKVPLSVKDKTAQDLLWEYSKRRRPVDAEFTADLQTALLLAGFEDPGSLAPRFGETAGESMRIAAREQLARTDPTDGGIHADHLARLILTFLGETTT